MIGKSVLEVVTETASLQLVINPVPNAVLTYEFPKGFDSRRFIKALAPKTTTTFRLEKFPVGSQIRLIWTGFGLWFSVFAFC